ncbi:MAG TPA: alpha/beta hydrolase [Gaiellaceae bacterium]|nr:alpha/beta hydrolase [Gaiellaceae bacterium]
MDAAPPPPPIIQAVCPAEARELADRVRCGHIRVPLDRSNPGGRKIKIYFEHYGRTNRDLPRLSTVVSLEGGPGFPVTDDRAARVALWRPVRERRGLVLVDLRGTGGSTPLGCKAFSRTTLDYWRRAGRCARQIGPERDFYSTSQAVQDVDAVLDAVRAGPRIDLYGDSYGTYAAQAYALRFGDRLRTLVLDGAYPLPGTDPAWTDLLAAVRRGLRLTCERRPNCPSAKAGRSTASLLGGLARRVREEPIVGWAPDWDGTPTRVRLNEKALVWIASATYYYPGLYRDLPAALRAARRGDTKPILRLAAETVTTDAGGEDPPHSSEALYLSVICHDYPQLWDPATPMGSRWKEAQSRVDAYPPGAFWPFSPRAWTRTEYEGVFACLRWPSPATPDPPDPPGATYPAVPTLVLNGDLDTITTSAQAAEVASRFPEATFVELVNSFHVTAIRDTDHCASRIYIRFLRTRTAGDTSCAGEIGDVHLVPGFARSLPDVAPALSAGGRDRSLRGDRRLAAAAAQTVADVVARWWVNYDGTSRGLRRGTWSYRGDTPVHFTLRDVELVRGLPVSGKVTWRRYRGVVEAEVTATGPRGRAGSVRLGWDTGEQLGRAWLRGRVGGRVLRATMLAP